MNKKIHNRFAAAVILLTAAFGISARAAETTDSVTSSSTVHESIFDYASPRLGSSHFTWGADVGASIDINGYDMSTFDLDVIIGYKNSILKTLGISAGVHRDFQLGTTFVPLQAVIRTSFVPRPSLLFMNLKTGYSFNTVGDSPTKGGFIFNAGIGFNLYRSQRVQTHLILSYEFIHLNKEQGIMIDKKKGHTDMIQVAFGLNF